jgi:hypothetical protein
MREIALAEPRAHRFKKAPAFVKGTIGDVLCHRTVGLLDQRDARLERGLVRMPAFRVGLAVPVRIDHPWARRKSHPILVAEHTAGALADRPHRLPLDAGGTESDEDEQLHGWPCT